MKKPIIATVATGMLLSALAMLPLSALALASAVLSAEQQAVHVLNRLAFGPKPGDVERFALSGVQRYIDAQLQPHSLAYPAALTERLASIDAANANANANASARAGDAVPVRHFGCPRQRRVDPQHRAAARHDGAAGYAAVRLPDAERL